MRLAGWMRHLFILTLLALVTSWVYWPSLDNGFLLYWDDASYVVNNPQIQQLSLDSMAWMLTTFHSANWHPLTWLSHALDYHSYGLQPWGHHLSNVVLHSLNTLWVYVLVLVLFGLLKTPVAQQPFRPFTDTDSRTLVAAISTALLFALHPQHVESVAWIAERKDVLSLFFMLPTLLAYCFYVRSEGRAAKYWYGLALLCQTLALMSKPMAVTLPLVLMLLDIYPLRRVEPFNFAQSQSNRTLAWRKWLGDKLPFFILVAISAVLTIQAQSAGKAVADLVLVALDVRILNAFHSVQMYLVKWLFPIYLVPFYQLVLIPFKQLWQHPELWIPFIVAGLNTVLAVYYFHRRQPWWLIAWLFYLITLLPVIGLVQVGSQAMADRYAYFPTLPAYILLGSGLAWLYARQTTPWRKGLALLPPLLLAGLLGLLTRQQIPLWQSDYSLWDYIVRTNPDSGLAQGKLGGLYQRAGNYEMALQHYQFSLGLSDDDSITYHLGYTQEMLKQPDKAIETYRRALDERRGNVQEQTVAWARLAQLYWQAGQRAPAQQALQRALALDPQMPFALNLQTLMQAAAP